MEQRAVDSHDSWPGHERQGFLSALERKESKGLGWVPGWDLDLRRRAGRAYTEFLEDSRWGWQDYVTLTFTEEIHPEQANRCYRRWVRKLNENSFGKHYRKRGRGITWVRGLEYQRRGVIHFHALFAGLPQSFDRFKAMKLWESTGDKCGFARIYPYKMGACRYLSKYVSKGGELDIWIGADKRGLDLFRVATF